MAQIKRNNTVQPHGKMILRTLAMPSDTNANGDIFGGWIMSQMDMGGGILAKEVSKGRIVTVSVDTINFLHPVSVGDVICCYGKVLKVGRTSMQIQIDIFIKKVYNGARDRVLVTEAVFTYVAIDENGKPRPIPRENNPELDDALSDDS